jgi:ABC-type dipeptide/oligopeptide/nickel transport system permease subunit
MPGSAIPATSAMQPIGPNQPLTDVPSHSIATDALLRLVRRPLSLICLVIAMVYLGVGLMGFLPFMKVKIDAQYAADKTSAPPSLYQTHEDKSQTLCPACWFGLDLQGRSVLWRTMYGARIALLIMVFASLLSIGIGSILGLLAGYFGGWVDDLITWLYSTISSIPWLLLVIAVAYILQNRQVADMAEAALKSNEGFWSGTGIVVLSLGLTDWVGLCRLIRGEVIKLREMDFVVASRAIGLGHTQIMLKHILPNTMHLIIITLSLGAVGYVQAEVVLSFLGLGITSLPSWGKMIDDSKLELLRGDWWEATAATMAILVISLALNLLGDALRDALDPKLHGTK